MKELKLLVDNDTEIVTITTLSTEQGCIKVNASAFDIRYTDEIMMPKSTSFKDEKIEPMKKKEFEKIEPMQDNKFWCPETLALLLAFILLALTFIFCL
jgi:hypothetical protein